MTPSRLSITVLVPFLFNSAAFGDIVGGDDVKPRDPIRESIAALYEPGSEGGSLCTASIIGPHTAVTAAHCLSPRGPKPVLIFGNDVRSASRALRPVTEAVVNPAWGKRKGIGMDTGDIAVVKFEGDLPRGYRPVALMRSEAAIRKGKTVTLAGYGISDAKRRTGAGVLRKTRVKVREPRPGKSEMIVNQSQGKGACHGDSGGPAFIRQGGKAVLAGVTNRAYPTWAPDDCKHQAVFTKVSSYGPWIEKNRKRMELRSAVPKPASTEAKKSLKAAKSRIGRRLPMGARHLARHARELKGPGFRKRPKRASRKRSALPAAATFRRKAP